MPLITSHTNGKQPQSGIPYFIHLANKKTGLPKSKRAKPVETGNLIVVTSFLLNTK
jgi:hypothetical protein